MNPKRIAAVLATAALVAFPAGAMAKKGDDSGSSNSGKSTKAKKPKKPKMATYVFKGTVAGKGDGTQLQVAVVHGNSKGKKFKGQTLTFDLSKAKLKVADVNGDSKRDLADVAVGDRVVVQAKLPVGAVDTSQALAARHVNDRGPVPAPEPEETEEETPPAPPAA